jgi:hypothetical protein
MAATPVWLGSGDERAIIEQAHYRAGAIGGQSSDFCGFSMVAGQESVSFFPALTRAADLL